MANYYSLSSVRSKKEFRAKVHGKYKGRCAYCGCKILSDRFHMDHFIPKRRGVNGSNHTDFNKERGGDVIENFMPACVPCNLSKSDWELNEWREQLELQVGRLERDISTFRNALRFKLIRKTKKPIVFYFEKVK